LLGLHAKGAWMTLMTELFASMVVANCLNLNLKKDLITSQLIGHSKISFDILLEYIIKGTQRNKQHHYNKIHSIHFYSIISIIFIHTYFYKNEK
jgi:hypothetical protein